MTNKDVIREPARFIQKGMADAGVQALMVTPQGIVMTPAARADDDDDGSVGLTD